MFTFAKRNIWFVSKDVDLLDVSFVINKYMTNVNDIYFCFSSLKS